MAKLSNETAQWARIGAEARLGELRSEEASILRAFPELGTRSGRGATRIVRSVRPTMSAARRKQVSERMKKYWAGRRREKTTQKG